MQRQIKKMIKLYHEEIIEMENLDIDDFKDVEKGLQVSRQFFQKLRVFVRSGQFKSNEDEIKFFKKQKPLIYGNLKF